MPDQTDNAMARARIALTEARQAARQPVLDEEEDAPEPVPPDLSDTYQAGLAATRRALAKAEPRQPPDPPRTRESASEGFKRVRAVYLNNRRPVDTAPEGTTS